VWKALLRLTWLLLDMLKIDSQYFITKFTF
jgi:hypothetical protein